jgi:hypothetical protein
VVTRKRVLVALFVAVAALVAIAGPGHVAVIVLAVAVAFVGVVALGMVHGVRAGVARAREEAASEPPGGSGDSPAAPGTHSSL